jgi:hypothetical protein
MTYRIPRHIGCPLHRGREGLVEGAPYVWLSGAEGEEPTAALALCMGGIDLIQPTNPVRGLYTEVIAQEA